jgi:hypothetical protein
VLFFLLQAPFLALTFNNYYTKYSKEDWRGFAEVIEKNSSDGDYVIVVPYVARLPLDIYYDNKTDGTLEFGVRNESEIQPILSGIKNNHVYLVVTNYIKVADPDGSTTSWLHNNTQRIASNSDFELVILNPVP